MQIPYLTVPQKMGIVSETMQQLNVTVSVYLYLFHVPPSKMLSRFELKIAVIFLTFLDFTFHQIFIHNSRTILLRKLFCEQLWVFKDIWWSGWSARDLDGLHTVVTYI